MKVRGECVQGCPSHSCRSCFIASSYRAVRFGTYVWPKSGPYLSILAQILSTPHGLTSQTRFWWSRGRLRASNPPKSKNKKSKIQKIVIFDCFLDLKPSCLFPEIIKNCLCHQLCHSAYFGLNLFKTYLEPSWILYKTHSFIHSFFL